MNLIRKVKEEKESNKATHIIYKYLPYWPLFLSFIIIAFAAAWLYMQYTIPQYEINARVLIKDENKGTEDAKALESLDMLSSKKTIDNEMEVIQSKKIIYEVVKNLYLYAPVYKENRFGDKPVYETSPINIAAVSPENLKASEKIYFKIDSSKITINNKNYQLNEWVRTPFGNLKFTENKEYVLPAEAEKFYFKLVPLKKTVSNVSSSLKVKEASKTSSIVNLTFNDENPLKGEAILNNIITVYNASVVNEKNMLAANTSAFINERLGLVESDLLAIEQKLQNYRSNKGAIDIGTQGKLYLESVSSNDQKVSEINMQLSVLDQVEKYVKSRNLSNGIVPSTVGVNDPGLTQMVKNIYELQIESESLKRTTGENNPVIISYNDRIEKIKPQIIENVQNQRRSLLASRNNLSATNNNYSSALQAIPETEKNLIDINRQQSIKSDIYTFLLQKKEETAISYISNTFGSKVVDNAESSEFPVTPKKKVVYFSSLLIALLLGFGVVTAKESLRRNIMFQKDIEQLTSLPVIGEITANDSKNAIVIGNNQRTLIAEQFRRLRTTLNYLGIGPKRKRILITSAISGEGKSFIATNLAVSLALTGKKVVLLDFDLNNPSLNDKLGINSEKNLGITQFLMGKIDAETIIMPTAADPNLFYIPTGKLPENPSELILNGKAEYLLNYLDTVFDYIVIDIAPVGPISDAYILSPLCDATLYIVRHAYTPKIFVERIDENNKLNRLTNAAIVFNGVSHRGFADDTNGYGYGYGYVYGNKKLNKKSALLNR